MTICLPDAGLMLIRGLYCSGNARPGEVLAARELCYGDIAGEAGKLGIEFYTVIDGRGRHIANRFLQRLRGTAPAMDVVEIMSVDEKRLRQSLTSAAHREQWRAFCKDASSLWDIDRSFILMGRPRQLVKGDGGGQRLLWFGNGLDKLSRSEFIDHYTTRHGPMVAGFSRSIGLRSYYQVPDEQQEICDSLRELGMGSGLPPAAFAELRMGMPSVALSAIRERRGANEAIKADENRHIDFSKSVLFLTAG